jgi:hypothetical protein
MLMGEPKEKGRDFHWWPFNNRTIQNEKEGVE